MLFDIIFWYTEKYLPNKRCRKLRERKVNANTEIEIKELSGMEFPVAFIVHDYQSVYDNARSYNDFDGNGDFKMFAEEIRTYNKKLYKVVRITYGSAISGNYYEPLSYIKDNIGECAPYWKGGEDFSEESIVKESNRNVQEVIFKERAESYIIYDGKVWVECGEPMYNIITFGLGHNHGGTGFFIQYFYNSNIGKNNYFNALERKQAIEYGKKVASNRGDTDSIEGMGDRDIIEVLMPEMVKRNPQKEHGDGDSFINSLKSMIEGTDSVCEAGLLAMAAMRALV